MKVLILLGVTLFGFATAAVVPECPSTGQKFYAHPKSCSKFYECKNGVLAEVDCIAGLFYNPQLEYCDFPGNVNCVVEEDSVEEDCVDLETFQCPATGRGFFPHPLRCTKFYECNNGVKKELDCIPGLHYNIRAGQCDFPEYADCHADEMKECEEQEEDEGGPVGKCPMENGRYPVFLEHSKNKHFYYECSWGTPYLFECPSNLVFDPTLNVCRF